MVRDLLHDQVSGGGSPAVQQRWHDLTAREAHFRTQCEEPLETPLAARPAPWSEARR
jgi:hypothetical protein